jgi:hypothetical protein
VFCQYEMWATLEGRLEYCIKGQTRMDHWQGSGKIVLDWPFDVVGILGKDPGVLLYLRPSEGLCGPEIIK